MALFKVENTGKQIEINSLTKLSKLPKVFADTWDNLGVVDSPELYDFYLMNHHKIIEVQVEKVLLKKYSNCEGFMTSFEEKNLNILLPTDIGVVKVLFSEEELSYSLMYKLKGK